MCFNISSELISIIEIDIRKYPLSRQATATWFTDKTPRGLSGLEHDRG